MYQIRHHLGTNMVLCMSAHEDFLFWQDESYMKVAPETMVVQAPKVELLAEKFTILTVLYLLPHEDIVIWNTESDRAVPMTHLVWKSFDSRVQTRIVEGVYDIELGLFMEALSHRVSYIEDMSGQSLTDYKIAKLFGPEIPPPNSIIRPNMYGRRHFKRLHEEAKARQTAAQVQATPRDGDLSLSEDPKHMYGVRTTFWQEVLITLGLTSLFK